MPARVLIIDDDHDIVESLVALVQGMPEDLDVLYAHSGGEALEKLVDGPVDVIVTDYRMPGMSGLEFLEAARGSYPKGAILITAYHEDARANLASRQGLVRRYMRKPGDPKVLREMIRELLFPERLLE